MSIRSLDPAPRPADEAATALDGGPELAAGTAEWRRAERATWLVAAAVYGAWLTLTWFYQALPWWLVLPLGGFVVAWHGSLQHEIIHGHPTPWRRLNELLVFPVLWLWLPYGRYREMHVAHHRCARLTCPAEDPESFYVAPERWRRMGPARRAVYGARNALAGRLLLGPLLAVGQLLCLEARMLFRGQFAHLRHWAVHVGSVALVLGWATGVCGIPVWAYLLMFAYPGLSLTLLRSFAEHRPGPTQPQRTVIVDSGPLFGLLYLNNNLHAVHHERPDLPWRLIGRRYRAERDAVLARNGGFRYAGYGEIARRFLLKPKDSPAHPGFAPGCDGPRGPAARVPAR
jgi:fatty acid desaturase